jgi:CRP-like cAMP-binding protein
VSSAPSALAVLRGCHQLADLPVAHLREAADAATSLILAEGECAYWAGETSTGVFVLESGRVAARFRSETGRVLDLGVALPGDLFGYFELFDGQPRSCDAVAVVPSTVWRIPTSAATALLAEDPAALRGLVHDLLRIVRLQASVAGNQVFRPVHARLAGLLLESVDEDGRVVLDGPQTLLAQRLGVARQTVSRELHALAVDGLVSIAAGGRVVTVLDQPSLAAVAAG